MSNLLVLDLSLDQGTIDWDALKASNRVAAVVAKATEGITYRDERFREYHSGAKRVGIPFGAYHFFRGNDDGMKQAKNFLQTISGYEGQVLPMVDCEEEGKGDVDAPTYLSRLGTFIHTVDKTLFDKLMLIYFEYSFWTDFLGGYDGFSGHPAWPAAYSNAATLSMQGTGWNDWTLWQNSDGKNDSIPGVTTDVDHDILRGPLATILR